MKAIINAGEFKRIIDNTKKFTNQCAESVMMKYIHLVLDAENKEIKAEATDGWRFSIEYAELFEIDESFECFIRPNIPSLKKIEYVELELKENTLYVTAGDNIQGYKQPKGIFYDLRKCLSESVKTEPIQTIGVNPKLLIDALNAGCDTSKYSRGVAKIEIRTPKDMILIRSGEKNIKVVLPINIHE